METLGLTVTQNYRKLIIPRTRHKVISAIFINTSFNMIFSWPRRRSVIAFERSSGFELVQDRAQVTDGWSHLCVSSVVPWQLVSLLPVHHTGEIMSGGQKLTVNHQKPRALHSLMANRTLSDEGYSLRTNRKGPPFKSQWATVLRQTPPSPPLSIKFSRDCLGQISKNWSRSR